MFMFEEKIDSREALVKSLAERLDEAFEESEIVVDLTAQTVTLYIPHEISGEEPDMVGHEVVYIEKISSSEEYKIMERFAINQPDEVADRLLHALSVRHPFRAFKDALDSTVTIDSWNAFRALAYGKIAEERLDLARIDYENDKIVCQVRKKVKKFKKG